MQLHALGFVIALSLTGWTRAPQTPPQDKPAEKAKVAVYDEQADAAKQIDAALARAKKENRRVLVQWGANWCGWCVKLHALCGKDTAISRELMYEYDVVLVDIGRFDKHMELAQKFGANLKEHGVPFLTVLASDGQVLANQDTGSLEAGDAHDPQKVLGFLKEHQAKYLVAEDLRAAAFAQAKNEGKRVFLHFGAPWCPWCHKLEDWMAQPQVAALLSKDFVDLKIDVDRTIGGKEVMKAVRGSEDGGIPWSALLDAEGKQLANSGGPKENFGFPYETHEIAAFVAMVEKARVNLTTAELETLRQSLVAEHDKIEARRRAAGAK
jgi:thiol-disulfide isomerase/thioredoxin